MYKKNHPQTEVGFYVIGFTSKPPNIVFQFVPHAMSEMPSISRESTQLLKRKTILIRFVRKSSQLAKPHKHNNDDDHCHWVLVLKERRQRKKKLQLVFFCGRSEKHFLTTFSESSSDAIFLVPFRASSIPYTMDDYQEQDVVGNQIVGAVKVGGWRYEDRSRYIGEWNQRGLRHGIGHLQLPDGTRYDGNFVNGLCTGLGCLWFSDGSKYEGEFHQGWFHGYGIFWRSDGMKFEGEFRGGRIWGLGLVTFHDFTHGFPRNEGYFQDCRLIRRRRCPDVVQKAQKTALMARSQVDHPY